MKRIILTLILALAVSPALAQQRPFAAKPALNLPIDPLGLNNRAPGAGSPLGNLLGALDAKLLPDLQYALKLAEASNSRVTAPCYKAWIEIINTRQAAVKDGDQAIPLPDPHLVTDFEKLVELRNSLQPESPFMIACSPVASMVKKDILGFIGTVIGGGAGLATLVPGL
jgi:hypothetical protein